MDFSRASSGSLVASGVQIEHPTKAYNATGSDDKHTGAARLSDTLQQLSPLPANTQTDHTLSFSRTLSRTSVQGSQRTRSRAPLAIGAKEWIKQNQRFLACLWSIGASGWSDACLGALLPYIQIYYGIGYKIASILFLATCIGYVLATCSNNTLTAKLGRGKVITLGAAVQVIGYSIMICAPPFPVLPLGWIIVAYGAATQLAQTNTFVSTLPNPHQALGSLHAAYGLGGALGPTVATIFISSGIKFSYFFAVSLAFAATNVSLLLLTFRLKRDNSLVEGHELTERRPSHTNEDDVEVHERSIQAPLNQEGGLPGLAEVLKNKTVLTVSFFLMLYCGAEVAIGGWIVTFLREDLGGSDAVGYAATGFWLGIALGRALLPRFSLFVGERRVVFLYIAISLSLEFVVWFSRNLYAAAIATALVGFFIGPFFPNAITLACKLLPKRLHLGAISIFACLGSCGNALFPFAVGMLASVKGIWVLQPVVVGLMAGMVVLWSLLPSVERRLE